MHRTFKLSDHNEIIGVVISDDDPKGILIDRPLKLVRDYVGQSVVLQLVRYLSLDDGGTCFIRKHAILAEADCNNKVVDYYDKIVDNCYMDVYKDMTNDEELESDLDDLTDEELRLIITGKMTYQ